MSQVSDVCAVDEVDTPGKYSEQDTEYVKLIDLQRSHLIKRWGYYMVLHGSHSDHSDQAETHVRLESCDFVSLPAGDSVF